MKKTANKKTETTKKEEWLRKIPSVDDLLQSKEFQRLCQIYPRRLVVEKIRQTLDEIRQPIKEFALSSAETEKLLQIKNLAQNVENKLKPSLRKVINATGVVIHTNLGRAPLHSKAQKQILDIAGSYSTLEFDLTTGERGSRYFHAVELLTSLTGAEDALIVNNNAAAVFLALNTFASGKEVIVWRGELIEIGGSFRLPEIMKMSGAILKEVGTTNKVYIRDYEAAISEETTLLMKVHPSNFRIVGFTKEVKLKELVELGRRYKLPVLYDAGSGALVSLSEKGFFGEPTVQEAIKAGASLVTFSGDKLLGGPQAGIVVGKKEFVEKLKKNHLNRALRIDKLTLAGLEATLKLYFEDNPWEQVPVLKLLSTPVDKLKSRAKKISAKINKETGVKAEAVATQAESGGGALPATPILSYGVALSHPKLQVQRLQELLRNFEPPIIARVQENKVILDMRTIFPEEEKIIIEALKKIEDTQHG